MNDSNGWLGVCHQCFALIAYEEVAHLDLYSDLCWIQCEMCAEAWGTSCGVDRKANPHPHGYFACPYRPGGTHIKVATRTSPSSPRACSSTWSRLVPRRIGRN